MQEDKERLSQWIESCTTTLQLKMCFTAVKQFKAEYGRQAKALEDALVDEIVEKTDYINNFQRKKVLAVRR